MLGMASKQQGHLTSNFGSSLQLAPCCSLAPAAYGSLLPHLHPRTEQVSGLRDIVDAKISAARQVGV